MDLRNLPPEEQTRLLRKSWTNRAPKECDCPLCQPPLILTRDERRIGETLHLARVSFQTFKRTRLEDDRDRALAAIDALAELGYQTLYIRSHRTFEAMSRGWWEKLKLFDQRPQGEVQNG